MIRGDFFFFWLFVSGTFCCTSVDSDFCCGLCFVVGVVVAL